MAFPIVTALLLCDNPVTPNDIPCSIVSTWEYDDCNGTEVKIYNSTPNLTSTRNFTEWLPTRLCNFTWNISDKDTYVWNVTNGDSGYVIVEEKDDQMASLGVIIFVMAIASAVFFAAFKVRFTGHELADYIIRKCLIIFGLFLMSLNTTIVVTIADTFGLGVNRELFRYLWIINWTIYLAMIMLFWTTITGTLKLWTTLSKMKRMGNYRNQGEEE